MEPIDQLISTMDQNYQPCCSGLDSPRILPNKRKLAHNLQYPTPILHTTNIILNTQT